MTEAECKEAVELFKVLSLKNADIANLKNPQKVSVTVTWKADAGSTNNGYVAVHNQPVDAGESAAFISALLRQITAERDAVQRRLAQLGCDTCG